MLRAECVDFSANFLCNSYNMNFQILTLVLHQDCYLNYFLKLSSVLRGLTVLHVFSADSELC